MDFDIPGLAGTFTIGGRAHGNGFDLHGTNAVGQQWMERCRLETGQNGTPDWIAISVFCASYAIAAFMAGMWGVWWPMVPAVSLAFFSAGTDGFVREWKQWHWVEHQTALLLERKLVPTREAYRTVGPATMRCGSARLVMTVLELTGIALVAEYGPIGIPFLASAVAAMYAVRSPEMERTSRGSKARRALVVLGTPAILCTLGIQRLMFLRRPTPLQESVAAAFGRGIAPLVALHTLAGAVSLIDAVDAARRRGTLQK